MSRVLVIGIDSATFDIINPMVERGWLPNFERLINVGVSADLRSTVPYVTAPGWTTMMSGVDPGKHGAFSMTTLDGYCPKPTDSRYVKSKRVWDYLSEHGYKSLIINLPITYPPTPLNGWMVTGTLTPDQGSGFTYPESLKEHILSIFPNYVPEIPEGLHGTDAIYNGYASSVELRTEVFKYLLKKMDWDLAVCVFNEPDKIQHKLFGIADEKIWKLYSLMDRFIGFVLDEFHDCEMIVASDHGGGPIYFGFNINQWLMEQGYLRLKYIVKMKNKIRRKRKTTELRSSISGSSPERKGFFNRYWDERYHYGDYSTVFDMGRTRAFGMESGVRINLKGREPQGIVDPKDYDKMVESIIHNLTKIVDEKGNQIMENIASSEDLYGKSPYISDSADVVFTIEKGGIHRVIHPSSSTFEPSIIPGDHRRNGIFIYRTARTESGFKIPTMDIGEITPIILFIMGIPIPRDMDYGDVKDWMRVLHPDKELKSTKEGIGIDRNQMIIKRAVDRVIQRREI